MYDELAIMVACKLWEKELDTSRWWSAAWKAKSKKLKELYEEEKGKATYFFTVADGWHTRAEAAEKKVEELESNLNAANERANRWEEAWEDIWDYAERKINQATLFYDKYRQEKKRVAELEKCDLCKDKAEYSLCQFHMNECVIGERDLKAELAVAEKRVAELEEALKTAIDAIRLLDDSAMGFGYDEDRNMRWPIRDELVDNFCKILNKV